MSQVSLSEFADKLNEIMRVIMRSSLSSQSSQFYKMKITMPQFFVMSFLDKNKESKMTDMANFLKVTTAAMTGIIDRLARDGYVVRSADPSDRRVIRIKLTSKGSKIVKDITDKRKQMTIKMFGTISDKERQDYLNILTKIKDNILNKNAG